MILRIVRRQRPHWGLQPRQPWTCVAERGAAAVTAVRTCWSLNTLQEQTIIDLSEPPAASRPQNNYSATGFIALSQNKPLFKSVLNY